MTLLDRFRTPSRQKHPDPAVRLAYVAELPLSERELIIAAAREDEDVRVRRAAVAKLLDPTALSAIARDDADAGVRADALNMLRDIALDVFEGVSEAEGLAAVDALAGADRTLAQIAKTSAREAIGLRALERLDPTGHAQLLGSIARHAPVESVRQAAFSGVHERTDILAVAVNGEFKETAVAAVDRLAERADLEQVAARAKNKGAAKRASAVLRELDERAAREAAPAVAATNTEEQVMSLEMPVETPVLETSLEMPQEAPLETPLERIDEASRAEREAEAARALEETENALATERARAALEAERAVQQAQAADERRALDDAEAAREAERRKQAGEAEARDRRDGLNRLNQLVGRADALIQKPDLSLKTAARVLRDLKAALADVPPLPSRHDYEEVVQRLKAAQAALTPKVQDLREVAEWQQWANIGIQEQLCEKMEALRTVEDSEGVARRIRELQEQWRQAADVPRAQGEALWRRFKAIHDELWTRCEAHFAAQAGVRSENLAKKVVLCERAEALADSTNWLATADAIKGLQAEWKAIGAVTRGQEKAVWERFRAACDRFFTRRQEDLAKRKTLWNENFAKKEALCLAVEALSTSTDWDRTAAEIRRLQNEWKTIGPVKKSRSEAIWQRFRAGCDAFFVRHAQRHDVARAERAAAREAICAELEALAPSPVAIDPASAPQAPEADQAPDGLVATVRGLRGRWQQELAARGVDREQAMALDQRFAEAFARVTARWPAAFAGTEMDPDANRKQLENLVKRVEDLAASLKGSSADAELSPTTKLAAMLKEALAANTIGGKLDVESRRRAAQEDIRQAQASWSRVGPVSEEAKRPLADRFQRAIKRISEAG
jgi:soluble cytochrome b562